MQVAVDAMRRAIEQRQSEGAAGDAGAAAAAAEQAAGGPRPHGRVLSITLDWLLWGVGEKARETAPPHHRTLTVFY
jgi:hypothetical protein